MTRYARLLAACALVACCASCSSSDKAPQGRPPAADPGGTDSATAAAGDGPLTPSDSALGAAAERIVAFLRGTAGFESVSLADTVALLLPAEGGGARQRLPREALRDRHAWTVQASRQGYSFLPPEAFTRMRVAPGRHFNCLEGSLSARVPEFGDSPHVGVRLEPPGMDSCLQGWNATFVFDTAPGPPRLVAAIYDQWEW